MLIWADAAMDDLHRIRASLDPAAATRVGRAIVDGAECLRDFPERGRPGPVTGTGEMPLPGLPWRLIYKTGDSGGLTILRVLA